MKVKTYKINCIAIILLFFPILSFSQSEICDNEKDDDGDGLIDCYDPDCSETNSCASFFIKAYFEDTTCRTLPPSGQVYYIEKLWSSEVVIDTRNTTVIGDIDNDGIPEVFSHNTNDDNLYMIDAITGKTKTTIKCPKINGYNDGVAIGDINKDGYGEIFVVTNDALLRCFNHLGDSLWVSNAKAGSTQRPSLANFNGDSLVEVYCGNSIFNAHNGELIAKGIGKSTGASTGGDAHPVAADVLPIGWISPETGKVCFDCDGLELICGNEVYSINIESKTMNLISKVNNTTLKDGYTSVADFNGDGKLDVIVVSSNFNVYVWDPRTTAQIGPTFTSPGNGNGGPANVGNYDSDPELEIGVAGKDKYILIDNDMTIIWEHPINDVSSNITGSSAFDFDCDGKFEIIYRSEDSLYIFDGSTGAVLAKAECGSMTRTELPVVADVDGDGQANIICSCANSKSGKTSGRVVAWNSTENNWPPTRQIWNQHNYYAVNINDDLTIPSIQQNHGNPSLPKRLNSFVNQMPLMDKLGNPQCFIRLLDLTINIDTVIGLSCDDSLQVDFTICNATDKNSQAFIPVSFYKGNPLTNGVFIKKEITEKRIPAYDCETFSYKIPSIENLEELHIFVNDEGTLTLTAPNTKFIECDSTNNSDNINVLNPFIAFTTSPNITICLGDSATLSAWGEGYSPITYFWSNKDTNSTTTVSPTSNTTYTVTLRAGNCVEEEYISAFIPTITADFKANPLSGKVPLNVSFQNLSSGTAKSFIWNFGNKDSTESNQTNPSHIYPDQGDYAIRLISMDENGCVDSVTYSVKVLGLSLVYYPNSFTPNGDGNNDTFTVLTNNIKEIKVEIFDRWGLNIHSWDTPTGSWDGMVNGNPAQEDSYIITIKYTSTDLSSHLLKGTITLIR